MKRPTPDALWAMLRHHLPRLAAAAIFIVPLIWVVGFSLRQPGLQVVIEDYVPAKAPRTVLLVLNTLGNWLFAAAGIFAVAKIAFSA